MPKYLEYLFTLFGALGGTGSSIGWVGVHRQHHMLSDQKGDPHSPSDQGWKVLFPSYDFNFNKWSLRDLITDPVHLFIHEYYFAIIVTWGLFSFLVFGLKGLIFLCFMPAVLQIWISVLSNYGNHKSNWGYKNFETNDHSINSWWLAALTWGEGWHNNHHKNPGRYSFQEKWWEIDISAVIIKMIKTGK